MTKTMNSTDRNPARICARLQSEDVVHTVAPTAFIAPEPVAALLRAEDALELETGWSLADATEMAIECATDYRSHGHYRLYN